MKRRIFRCLAVLFASAMVSTFLLGSLTVSAASVVPDPVLKKIIQWKLGLPLTADVTAADVARVTSLSYSGYAASAGGKIASLAGLQYASGMTLLDITDCSVTSLAPIRNLTALRTLVLTNNPLDLRTGSVDYAIVQALKARGCHVVYNTPKPSPYLTGLKASVGMLTPKFAAGIYSFKLVLPDTYAGRTVTITPVKADPKAKMLINGHSAASYRVSLAVGSSRQVVIKVTAKDNSAYKTYTVTVSRPSSNCKLSALKYSAGHLYPSFRQKTTSYVLALKSTVSSVKITPKKADSRARLLIDGASASSKTVSVSRGTSKIVKITVIAQSGASQNYYVVVCRAR